MKGKGRGKGKGKEKIEEGKQVGSRVLRHARASVIGDVMVGKLLQDTLVGPSPPKKSIAIGPNDILLSFIYSDIEHRVSDIDYRRPSSSSKRLPI